MSLKAAFAIVRPLNCAMIGLAVIVRAFVSRPVAVVPINLVRVIVPDVLFIYLAVSIGMRPSRKNALAVKRTSLLGMLVGLVVFIMGAM